MKKIINRLRKLKNAADSSKEGIELEGLKMSSIISPLSPEQKKRQIELEEILFEKYYKEFSELASKIQNEHI